MSDSLFQALETVHDEVSFLRFVEALERDRRTVETAQITPDGFKGEWANQSIGEYLEAAAAWAKASEFGSRPGPKHTNLWRLFAQFLIAGRGYE